MCNKSDWISQIGIRENLGKIRRPLLSIRKKVIRKIATNRTLQWIEDPTNTDISIHRNNVRMYLLPNTLKINSEIITQLLDNAHSYKLNMEIIISKFLKNKKQLIKYKSNEFSPEQ